MSKWKFKDPNKRSNAHKFEKIVPRNQLANARQEAFKRFKREGDTEHMALVKTLNYVGVKEHQNKKHRG